jgi:hypothetical protein
MKKTLIALLVLGFAGTLSAQTMTLQAENIEIRSPINWLAQYTQSPQLFIIYSPIEPNDTFQENLNLTTEALPSPYTVSAYMEASQNVLQSVYQSFELEVTGDSFHIYTGTVNGVTVKQIQYFWVVGNTAYILTGSALPSTFQNFADTFQTIADSVVIK